MLLIRGAFIYKKNNGQEIRDINQRNHVKKYRKTKFE